MTTLPELERLLGLRGGALTGRLRRLRDEGVLLCDGDGRLKQRLRGSSARAWVFRGGVPRPAPRPGVLHWD